MDAVTPFTVVIPARYASTRLPAKPLADIAGKPMVQRVYEQAVQSGAKRVIIATDDERIAEVTRAFAAEVCLTSAAHQSGTERLAEVIEQYQLADDEIVVNVQGDEPLIPPSVIAQVAQNLATFTEASMATLAVAIRHKDEVFDPNVVKVVTDKQGYALYFSRASIPWDRDNFAKQPAQIAQDVMRHIGIYAYRAEFVKRYLAWPASPLEKIESLEQLRVLYQGEKIHVALAKEPPPSGVDTFEDLEFVRQYVTTNNL